ncbi:MAG: macro domain-containing protein [Bryobacterales bacterium]|nr:macro domain-containing protein [Bryobacterales bacterium]
MTATATATTPIERKVHQTVVRLMQGDLTALEVDAFVHYAKENLELGSGYGTAIQSRGGGAVKKEVEKIGGIRMGEAVMTTAGGMAAKHIIHACGPKFQESDTEGKLRDCMNSALQIARENGLKSVAFPPMGAGFYGVPLALSAQVMIDAIRSAAAAGTPPEVIIICTVDGRDFLAFKNQVGAL